MADARVNGIRLHYEERGQGPPILCIHGTGSSALVWSEAAERLAGLGRVIAYDRRGCGRSERPEPYERTSVAEHADDAAALLDELSATPAVVVGRSYGATVAADLAVRFPDRVAAMVLLEGDTTRELAPELTALIEGLAGRLRTVADRDGVGAVGEALIGEVAGLDAWRALPDELRGVFASNGRAILAELEGEWWLEATAAALAQVDQPTLVVVAEDSPPAFAKAAEAMARALPRARLVRVGGGHLIDPAGPAVIGFVQRVIAPGRQSDR